MAWKLKGNGSRIKLKWRNLENWKLNKILQNFAKSIIKNEKKIINENQRCLFLSNKIFLDIRI